MVFNMTVMQQLNLKDRTLLAGVPNFDIIPPVITMNNQKFKVIGLSQGINPPAMCIEIERTDIELIGKEITD